GNLRELVGVMIERGPKVRDDGLSQPWEHFTVEFSGQSIFVLTDVFLVGAHGVCDGLTDRVFACCVGVTVFECLMEFSTEKAAGLIQFGAGFSVLCPAVKDRG